MFHAPIDTRFGMPPAVDRLFAGAQRGVAFPARMDLCPELAPAPLDCEGLRFAAAVRRSQSRDAFRPAFATGDWRVFASFCVARRLAPGQRVVVPGRSDRTLRFLVEGSLWQASSAASAEGTELLPGAILGEDALFCDVPCEQDVRALEPAVVLELSLARQREMTAACPEIGFELLRAAGAVIAARGRPCSAPAGLAVN